MANRCAISGKSRQVGNRVSHAKNRTKHAFRANIQTRNIFVPELGRAIKVKLSTRIIRTIDKIGLQETLKKNGLKLSDIVVQ